MCGRAATGTAYADFDQSGVAPITSYDQGSDAGSAGVRAGDTRSTTPPLQARRDKGGTLGAIPLAVGAILAAIKCFAGKAKGLFAAIGMRMTPGAAVRASAAGARWGGNDGRSAGRPAPPAHFPAAAWLA